MCMGCVRVACMRRSVCTCVHRSRPAFCRAVGMRCMFRRAQWTLIALAIGCWPCTVAPELHARTHPSSRLRPGRPEGVSLRCAESDPCQTNDGRSRRRCQRQRTPPAMLSEARRVDGATVGGMVRALLLAHMCATRRDHDTRGSMWRGGAALCVCAPPAAAGTTRWVMTQAADRSGRRRVRTLHCAAHCLSTGNVHDQSHA